MKHKFETRVNTFVCPNTGAETYFVEKRVWFFGLLPLNGWEYVSTPGMLDTVGKAITAAETVLARLYERQGTHGKVRWTSRFGPNREGQ